MIYHSAVVGIPDNVDDKDLNSVHFATWIRAPFRFRTGESYRFCMDGDRPFEIWIFNRVLIPEGMKDFDALRNIRGGLKDWSELSSDVIVYIADPYLKDVTVDDIREGKAAVPHEKNFHRALSAFNEFVCAYATATNQIFGGLPLRMLSDSEYTEKTYAVFSILAPANHKVTQGEIEGFFGWKPERDFGSVQTSRGELDDLPHKELAGVESTFRKITEHAFYEIAFKAKTEMVERDPIVALILACAALEGVHAEFLRQMTKKKDIADSLTNDLLREQGIYTLVQVTPRLFLSDGERPDEGLIRRCAEAIRTRNDIVHAKRSKGGQYKLRAYTFRELSDAYSAVMGMYRHLLKLVEGSSKPKIAQ